MIWILKLGFYVKISMEILKLEYLGKIYVFFDIVIIKDLYVFIFEYKKKKEVFIHGEK